MERKESRNRYIKNKKEEREKEEKNR